MRVTKTTSKIEEGVVTYKKLLNQWFVRHPKLKQAITAGLWLTKRMVTFYAPHVVYKDNDTICLRASSGREMTFTLNPEVDRDELIRVLKTLKYPKAYHPRRGPEILLAYMELPAARPRSKKSFLQKFNILAGEGNIYSSDMAKSLAISSFEAADIMEYARREIMGLLLIQINGPEVPQGPHTKQRLLGLRVGR